MGWFKVNDQFHASHKLLSIPKRSRFQAAGLKMQEVNRVLV